MQRAFLYLPALIGLLLLANVAAAQRNELSVGSQAPQIDVDEWFGQPFQIQSGQVYVVEFWATWCGPCRAAIPHLSKLQDRYRGDVHIVGVTDEDADTVGRFVQAQGDRIRYSIATDRRNSTNRSWMRAAGIQGIPAVFIVDRNRRIAFIGRPHDDRFEEVLDLVVRGRYDPEATRRARPLIDSARRARQVRDYRNALRRLDEAVQINPEALYDLSLLKFEIMIADMNDRDQALQFAQGEFLQRHGNDALAMHELATFLASDPAVDDADRDLDLALQLAEQAVRVADEREKPGAMAAAASIHHARGEFDQAVELQREAYFTARPNDKPGFRQQLDTYRESRRREASRR